MKYKHKVETFLHQTPNLIGTSTLKEECRHSHFERPLNHCLKNLEKIHSINKAIIQI